MSPSARLRIALGATALLAFSNFSTVSYAWGPEGHRTIGTIAETLLKPHAKAKVASLLGLSLSLASTWGDCVKDVRGTGASAHYAPDPRYHASCVQFETPIGIAAMEDYVRRNATNCDQTENKEVCHKQYHYTDIASVHDHYDPSLVGTSDHDLVAAISAAQAVLRGNTAPAPFNIKDKREALLLLAHLVGDIHQPLHVGAVYLDPSGAVIDPDAAQPFDPKTETRGGNSIDDGAKTFHSLWDSVSPKVNATHLARILAQAKLVKKTTGANATWAGKWASETVVQSHKAFTGLSFPPSVAKPGHWTVAYADKPNYNAHKRTLQDEQMAKAGARFAQLLNSVWP